MHEVEFIRYVCIYAYVKSGCAARVYRPPRVLLLPLPSFPFHPSTTKRAILAYLWLNVASIATSFSHPKNK
jgi:hypothetical protein